LKVPIIGYLNLTNLAKVRKSTKISFLKIDSRTF